MLDGKVVHEQALAVSDGKAGPWKLSKEFTAALRPGTYWLTTEAPELTIMPMPLVIGPGRFGASPLRYISYGDYEMIVPMPMLAEAPDVITSWMDRNARFGLNFIVDRLGNHLHWRRPEWSGSNGVQLRDDLTKRLTDDPIAVHPQRIAELESPLKQSFAAMSAFGMEYVGIPNYMDDGLPIGTTWNGGGEENDAAYKAVTDRVEAVTRALMHYPAFRGWNWTANWWVGRPFAGSAKTPEQRAAFEAAIKKANETGEYDAIIDEVSDIWLNHAVRAQQRFREALYKIAPGMPTSTAGPYRAVTVYPPITFSNVDEIDLHYQAEQIAPPQSHVHAVDFLRAQNKPNWGHPELWNDAGTGDQILPLLTQQLMRGITPLVPVPMAPRMSHRHRHERRNAAHRPGPQPRPTAEHPRAQHDLPAVQ
jgi:hypothetical protein